MPRSPIQFDEFSLDCERYELLRAGHPVKIEKIPMELLILLVDKDGRLVTRQEIVEQLWGKDVFVDTEHGINTAIRKIRQALHDDPEKPRFVQTVTGKGYRFVGQPTNGTAPATAVLDPAAPADVATPPPHKVGLGKPLLVASSLLLSLAIAFAFNVFGLRDRFFGSRRPFPIHSIAVLPLANLSGDPSQDYFADGMTDELITMLARNTSLRVVSRTSAMQYKAAKKPLMEIGRELGADGILEGSLKRSGNTVHMTVQLIYAPTDTHVWAESFDRDVDLANLLPSEISQTITRQVGLTASALPLPSKRINPAAHEAYLLGRYYWFASEERSKAKENFQKAIDLQPDYAAAWSGLADFYLWEALARRLPPNAGVIPGDTAARKALSLDSSLPEAHNSMAIAYFCRWDVENAERESARAVELNPNFSEAHHFRSFVLEALNRPQEALDEQKKATELDPFARPGGLAGTLARVRHFDAALEEARLRSQAEPDNADLHELLSFTYVYKGMEKEAATEWETSARLRGDISSALAVHNAFEGAGLKGIFEWQLAELKKQSAVKYTSPLDFAEAYAQLKQKDESLHYLEQALDERSPALVRIQNDPDLDFLHSDPRYQMIVKKVGLHPARETTP